MMWGQSLAAFAVWIAYGFLLRRSQSRLRQTLSRSPRGLRVGLGSVGFLASIAVLFGGLYGVNAAGGIVKGQLTWWGWLIVVVVGAAFIGLQVLGAGAMITLIQDQQREQASHASNTSQGKPEA